MANAISKAERLSKALSSARGKARESARLGTRAVVTVTGGVAAGWCDAKYPTIGSTNVQTATAVGALAVLLGLAGFADDYSDELVAGGAGMLAAKASDAAEQYFND